MGKLSARSQSGTLSRSSIQHVVNDPSGTPTTSKESLTDQLALGSFEITYPQLTASVTTLSPTGFAFGAVVHLTTDGSDYNVYSMTALAAGQKVWLHNGDASGGGIITLVEEYITGTTDANRFKGGNRAIYPGQVVMLEYSDADTRWLVSGLPVNANHFTEGAAGLSLTTSYETAVVPILVFDDSQDVAVGDGAGDVFWRVPSVINGWNLVGVADCVQTAGTTGTTDVQIHNVTQAVDMLTTKITIDSGETDSSTAATAAVIDTANDDVATGDQIRIDVDAISTTAPKGLLVELQFRKP